MSVSLDLTSGRLSGPPVTISRRTVAGLVGWYRDEEARAALNQETVVYRVEAFEPAPEGQEGAVCAATTYLEPGLVGDEYHLTRGHFHINQDKPELCLAISGEGALVFMNEARETWTVPLTPGALVPVPIRTAHRAANTGGETLVFISFWPSETGHDYETIARDGFSARLRRVDGKPMLVPEGTGR